MNEDIVEKLTNHTIKYDLRAFKIDHPIQPNAFWYVGRSANIQKLTWVSKKDYIDNAYDNDLTTYHWDKLILDFNNTFENLP